MYVKIQIIYSASRLVKFGSMESVIARAGAGTIVCAAYRRCKWSPVAFKNRFVYVYAYSLVYGRDIIRTGGDRGG